MFFSLNLVIAANFCWRIFVFYMANKI